jgi:hypothetical protein
VVARECNLFSEIFWQNIEQLPVSLLVQKRAVDKFRVVIGFPVAGGSDGEMEVES